MAVLDLQGFEMLGNIEHTQMSGQELERYSKQILIKNIGGGGYTRDLDWSTG